VVKLLRPRELSILALYSEGLSTIEIADIFVISPHTVRTHVRNAYRRLASTRARRPCE
jgi:DNA-binding CsgD family transcriptional regulator